MPRYGLSYDLWFPGLPDELRAHWYRMMLDQCAYADEHGFEFLLLFEHHGTDGGYLPSPILLATAAAARTRRLSIEPLIVAPLYDPIKLAEDLAVCDLVSGGRLRPTLGVGYRAEEFEMFGQHRSDRRTRLEAAVAVLRSAWTGEPFDFEGRRLQVTPRPAQRPGPPIHLAGNSAFAARSAARLGDGFVPMERAWWEVYREERRAVGKSDPGPPPRSLPVFFLHVAEDPERELSLLAPFLLAAIRGYRTWTTQNASAIGARANRRFSPHSIDDLRTASQYRVLSPDECVELLRQLGAEARVVLRPLWGGHDPELAWSSLTLFVDRVIPAIEREPRRGGATISHASDRTGPAARAGRAASGCYRPR
jgi:alkanesulfonate monooxygenase SsuD/methylene tetrahydromethanopterin reductase-like flavin-dependent oxidoreductase (luciferase family)